MSVQLWLLTIARLEWQLLCSAGPRFILGDDISLLVEGRSLFASKSESETWWGPVYRPMRAEPLFAGWYITVCWMPQQCVCPHVLVSCNRRWIYTYVMIQSHLRTILMRSHLEYWASVPVSEQHLGLCRASARFVRRWLQRGRHSSPGLLFYHLKKTHIISSFVFLIFINWQFFNLLL